MNLFTTDDTPDFDAEEITVNGHTLFERRSKTTFSKTALLIHGINVSEKYYRPFALELQKEMNVIAIDLPGFGTADNKRRALRFDEHRDIIAEYIRTHIKNPVTLIGQSMGTQLCARVAVQYPELVTELIQISPTINHKERHLALQVLRLLQDSIREPLPMNWIIISDFFRFGPGKFWQTQKQMIHDKPEDMIARVAKPVLFIVGQKDPISPPAWMAWLAGKAPQAQQVVIPKAPHNLQFTHPKEVSAECVRFLQP